MSFTGNNAKLALIIVLFISLTQTFICNFAD